ncbi:glucuronate isomerase [Kocuria aegyptia]|uniref:Uronate isomerase n=1 Tax=Kocuria aegyptia TaxID=330943 RepID=A0ABP4WY02_9MICC
MSASIAAHPDRLLPADPGTRSIARALLALVEDLPIVSPHGHVDARVLAENTPFPDPTGLLISPDHYVTRLLHANGVALADLGVGGAPDTDPREAWRIFCRHWGLFDGTASGYWLRSEFVNVFGIDDALIGAEHADELYDRLQSLVGQPEFRPRALFERFGLEVMATTDDPLDDLAAHARLAADRTFAGRVLPTFRPDAYVKFSGAGFAEKAHRLIDTAGDGSTGYAGYLHALQNRRAHFLAHGAVSADHGTLTARTLKLDAAEAGRLFEKGLRGEATAEEAEAFEASMTYQFARMAVEDGLVMTLHPGVHRNHSPETFARHGADSGHDIPFAMEYTRALQPLLADFGTAENFHLVLFTIDETVFSREIAPLAGFYPSVYVGAPWWFIDEPDAMLRFRSAVTGTAGFSRSSGFIDDTRAFCSIPARHDASRRTEASFLARLVAEHRISEERAAEIIVDVVDAAPRRAFKL